MNKDIFKQNKPFKEQQLNKSAGILDDYAVRKVVSTREGTITKTPVNNNDIVNKAYSDGGSGDKFLLNTGDTASGNYNFNANTLFIDVDLSRVGIGTATPSAKLEVIDEYDAIVGNAGDAEGRGVVGYGSIGVYCSGSTGLYSQGSTYAVNAYSAEGVAVLANGSTYDLYCGTAGGVSYFAGNVGIGTTTPASKLEVNGQISITGASRMRVTKGAAHAFPHNTWTVVEYDNEEYDNLEEYDTDMYRFTASKAGYYLISASTLINQTAWAVDDVWHIAIWKNGAVKSIGGRNEVQAASTTYLQSTVTDILYLAANDYIEIYGYLIHVGGANLYASGLYNYFAVHRLS